MGPQSLRGAGLHEHSAIEHQRAVAGGSLGEFRTVRLVALRRRARPLSRRAVRVLWQLGFGVLLLVLFDGGFCDQSFVCQPLHGPDLCPGIA